MNSRFILKVEIVNVTELNAASYSVVLGQSLQVSDEGAELKVFEGNIGGTVVPVDQKVWDPNVGVLTIVQSLSGLSAASGDGFLARIELPFTWEVGSTRVFDFDQTTSQPVLSNKIGNPIAAVWEETTVLGIQ